jgi:hypothetical protein
MLFLAVKDSSSLFYVDPEECGFKACLLVDWQVVSYHTLNLETEEVKAAY